MFNPFCKCLNPNKVVNPYTHESMVVPCGKCKACILAKNSRYAFQCDLESYTAKHTVFVTLTYSNEYLPVLRPFLTNGDLEKSGFERNSYSLLDNETGELLGDLDILSSDLKLLQRKFNLCGDIPYLRKYDLQLFLKRFRYYVSKQFPSEKIRYYAVGEYGPVHFRPHYHVLLFLQSDQALSLCSEFVSKAWTYGRVDCQLSKGKCSSYVAGYVNSSVLVPEIFKIRALRPFNVHSQKLGQGFLQGSRSEVYSLTTEQFIKRSVVVNGKYKEFDVWRSAYSYYFPKCRGFVNKSSRERAYSYAVYDTARRLCPGCENAFSLAKEIATSIYMFYSYREPYIDTLSFFGALASYEKIFQELGAYFYDPEVLKFPIESPDFNCYVMRIYTELLLSKHFLYFVCDKPTLSEQRRKLKYIEQFYSDLDYMNLIKFFENQQLFYESDLVGDDDMISDKFGNSFYPYFYDDEMMSNGSFKKTPCYSFYDSDVTKLFDDRIKHKKLNDLNKIFLDM